MIFDTDILIWLQRGNAKAAKVIESCDDRCLSIQSYMELLQCASNKSQHKIIREFLQQFNFKMVALSEAIGSRAAVYIEEYALSSGLRAGDALIAATAIEHNETLCTSNGKHFKMVQELQLETFKP